MAQLDSLEAEIVGCIDIGLVYVSLACCYQEILRVSYLFQECLDSSWLSDEIR